MNKKGLLLVISGPSGAGKGTVVNHLIGGGDYSLSISATTREPRVTEVHGSHYFFKTKEQFNQMIQNNELLEYAEFCGNSYGTPRDYVEHQISLGKCVILEIETIGALQIKKSHPDAVLVFLTPPSIAELRNRLVLRNTEDEIKINMRMRRAEDEIRLLDEYDYIVINDTIADAVKDIETIVRAERMKTKRHLEFIHKALEVR